jgi:hypothetical protein
MYTEVAAHPIGMPTPQPVGHRVLNSPVEATSMG